MDTRDPSNTRLTPPPPPHEGEPQPTLDDPTAGGYYCGSQRSRRQLAAIRENTGEEPWPWCLRRAGQATDHPRVGRCHLHGGASPGGRKQARLRLAELAQPAIATLARALADPEVPWPTRVRAAQDVLDRAGHPRRVDVDPEAAREMVVARLEALANGQPDSEVDVDDEPLDEPLPDADDR